MAEAVRPVKKKKKAKKSHTEDKQSLGIAGKDIAETERGAGALESQPKLDLIHGSTVIACQDEASSEQDFAWDQHGLEREPKIGESDTVAVIGALTEEHVRINVDGHEHEGIIKDVTEVTEFVDDNLTERHVGINVDDEDHRGIDDVLDVHKSDNADLGNEPVGIIEAESDIGGTSEAGESNVDVVEKSDEPGEHDVIQEDDESSTDIRQQDGETLDSEMLEGMTKDTNEEEDRNEVAMDNEREHKSSEVPGEVSNDLQNTVEKLEEMNDGEEHVIFGEQSVVHQTEDNIENLGQEDKNLARNEDIIVSTASETRDDVVRSDETVSLPLTPQDELQNPSQSQVMSMSDDNHPGVSQNIATEERNFYGHIHNIFGKQQVSTNAREAITAFTEDDLKSFYYNPALMYVDDCVDAFIKETLEPRRESEFYELLNTYQNTSKNLRNVNSDIEVLRKKCVEQKNTIWSTETKTVTVQVYR